MMHLVDAIRSKGPGCLAALLMLLAVTGCRVYPASVDRAEVLELSAQLYPEGLPFDGDLDIVVLYHSRWFRPARIQLVNRMPQAIGPMQLWLNEQYVGQIDGLQVGEENFYTLTEFINAHREPFPVGYLVTPDRSEPVVAAELFDPQSGERYRLTVQKTTLTPYVVAGHLDYIQR